MLNNYKLCRDSWKPKIST